MLDTPRKDEYGTVFYPQSSSRYQELWATLSPSFQISPPTKSHEPIFLFLFWHWQFQRGVSMVSSGFRFFISCFLHFLEVIVTLWRRA